MVNMVISKRLGQRVNDVIFKGLKVKSRTMEGFAAVTTVKRPTTSFITAAQGGSNA